MVAVSTIVGCRCRSVYPCPGAYQVTEHIVRWPFSSYTSKGSSSFDANSALWLEDDEMHRTVTI